MVVFGTVSARFSTHRPDLVNQLYCDFGVRKRISIGRGHLSVVPIVEAANTPDAADRNTGIDTGASSFTKHKSIRTSRQGLP